MKVVRASLSLECRKQCADACGERNRAMRGGACCRVGLGEVRAIAASEAVCKARFLRRMQ